MRRLGLLFLAGALSLAPVLTGCATQGPFSLRAIAGEEGFNLSGQSKRPLRSILIVFRELEANDRPF